jgi:hypothetical protein
MEAELPLERVHYFTGQVLSADDFRAEQNYFLTRLRRRNRHLHGWGVVTGLAVSIDESGGLTIDPGLAIDCAGNEIVVPSQQELSIPGGLEAGHVALVYVETPTSPTPALDPSGDPEAPATFTRIREGFRLELSPANPCSGHGRSGPGTAGCGLPHGICIARFRKRKRRGWSIEARGRRRA